MAVSPVVLQDAGNVVLAQGTSNLLSLLLREGNAPVVLVDTHLSVQVACIYTKLAPIPRKQQAQACILTLSKHLNGFAKRTPGLSMDGVRMRGRNYIRPGLVDFRMNHESSLVDGVLGTTLGDVALGIDKNQIRCLDGGEVLGEGIHPEVILQDGV